MLKNIFIIVLLSMSFGSATAQNKIGVVLSDTIIEQMQEVLIMNKILKQCQDSLIKEWEKLQEIYDKKMKEWNKYDEGPVLPESEKQTRRKEAIEMVQKSAKSQSIIDKFLQQKAQQLYTEIQNKFKDVVKQVAEENGYTYVLDMSDEHLRFLPLPPYDDITQLVITKLGL